MIQLAAPITLAPHPLTQQRPLILFSCKVTSYYQDLLHCTFYRFKAEGN